MAKNYKKDSDALSKAYHAIEEPQKWVLRDEIRVEAGISEAQFYSIVRTGRAKKLVKDVFARILNLPVEVLFPED